MKTCPQCGKEYPDDATVCALDQTPLKSQMEVRLPVPGGSHQPSACPSCGTPDNYKPAVELRSSFSLLAFLAGGILAVMFRNAGRAKRVQCLNCGTIFNIRSPASKLSLLIFWLLVSPTIILLIAWLIFLFFHHE